MILVYINISTYQITLSFMMKGLNLVDLKVFIYFTYKMHHFLKQDFLKNICYLTICRCCKSAISETSSKLPAYCDKPYILYMAQNPDLCKDKFPPSVLYTLIFKNNNKKIFQSLGFYTRLTFHIISLKTIIDGQEISK